MVVRIAGKQMYLWRAVDHEGEVLEILVQLRREKRAAIKLMRKLLHKQGFAPKKVTTDKLSSYGAAFKNLGFPASMSRVCGKIIGPRIRIKWRDDASARCSASNQPHRHNGSLACTPPSITPSISSAISSPGRRFASSDQKLQRKGAP
jgi:transposase-like protein